MDLHALRARLTGGAALPPVEVIAAAAQSDDARNLVTGPLVRAAVLVPLLPESGVLLTKRTAHLSAHAGQVAFPGGRIDPADANPTEAALREAFEEIALAPESVEVLGQFPDYVTGTGFQVTPILGVLHGVLDLVANPHEVEAIFTLPMNVLLDPAAPERRRAHFRGRDREFWVWPHPDHYIWGATAAILVHLAAELRATGLVRAERAA